MQCISDYLGCGQVVLACPGQYIFIKTSLRKLGLSEQFPLSFPAVFTLLTGTCCVLGVEVLQWWEVTF